MKNSIFLKHLVDSDIKVGDVVRVIDGSGFSPVDERDPKLIVFPIEGYSSNICEMTATVIATGVKNYGVNGAFPDEYYVQDTLIDIRGHLFRTCSQFLAKI
jgi:hypothetical protein